MVNVTIVRMLKVRRGLGVWYYFIGAVNLEAKEA